MGPTKMRKFIAFLSLLLFACVTHSALAQIKIGETNILTFQDNGNANLLITQNATLSQTAVLSSLSFYVSAAMGNLRLGIYDSTGPNGGPGALKAQTNSFAAVKGWNTQVPTTTPTLNPGKYWLAYLPSANSLNFVKDVTTGTSAVYKSFTFGSMPGTFPSTPSTDTAHWSFYASLTPAATITGISLSSTSVKGGATAPVTIGTITTTMNAGSFTGSLSLSDNTNFQLSGSTLQTKTALTIGANYPLTITATQAGAGNSPFSQAFTIAATGITGVSLTSTQFVGGSPSGTAVGQIKVTEAGGAFGGTFGLSGADAANFTTSGGFLYTSGTVAAGTYNIIITATQSGVGGSPFAQAFVITGSATGSQQWMFLTANQTFSPSTHSLIQGQAITVEAIGSGSGAAGTNDNTGGCGGAYAKPAASYALGAADISNGMAVTVGAAGAVGSAGHTSTVLDGNGSPLASASGGGAAAGGGCAGGSVLVGTGFNGGANGSAPNTGGGGAGGSAGPNGPGGAGGTGSDVSGGGGGGGGGANGLGNANATGSTTNGGVGGGPNGGAGGIGNTTPTNGAPGTLGSGGGGGGATTSGSANAGNGGSGGQVCNIWDAAHCLGGGPGAGGSATTPGHGGNGGVAVGYGCGGAGFGDSNPSLTTQGIGSAGCPGLVVIGWNGMAPVQGIASVALNSNSYTVGAAANTVIGTISVAMSPTSPPFNYPTSTITVSDSTHFKIVNVGGVATLEANATLSSSSYTLTLTATQSGATGSPFTTGTLTITGKSLSMTVVPTTLSIPSSTSLGSTVATLQGVWSNADPFTGTYSCGSTCDNNTFSLSPGSGSSNLLIVNPSGPGVGFDANTVQNVTVTATQ